MRAFHLQFSSSLVIAGLMLVPAMAQTPSGPPPAPRQHAFIDRFNAANTTHDGHLTLAQAEAGNLPMVAQHFAAIDTQHKGYVTLDDLRAYRQQQRAAHAQQPRQGE